MFFQNKKKKLTSNNDEIENKKVKARKDIQQLVEHVSSHYSHKSVMESFHFLIQKKAFIYHTDHLYKENLLKEIIIFRELYTALQVDLHRLLKWNKFNDKEDLNNHINETKKSIVKNTDIYLNTYYDEYFHKYFSNDRGVKGIESEYLERKLKVSMLHDLLLHVLQSSSSSSLSEIELSGKWLVNEIIIEIEVKADTILYMNMK
ncbi:hypothetical protein [Jeotgalibacillus proteolyticus]|uniref:Uncharacterized protein n=1 Tax=Jeotgalibacillus proteolyticus TaxID=2082395 RepID=A0A2S5GBL6_9BACL|nr:hypothetical protein [Jeotgalibacillus proteolyticus]PPA70283.1 hypothetical protein C4B60_11940 [Jeotgalibacillus proteolyticus]